MGKMLGVTDDSRKVEPGWVFVAVKGSTVDGKDFIDEAKKNGASEIKILDSRQKLGEFASQFYSNPSEKIKVIGVTGTKGKTTTCHLIHHILASVGKKVGLISSITTQGFHTTTPDAITLNKELSEMVKRGYEFVVLEVSSHGIDQGRIAGINFEVGVLTNIAPEHLDYHKTFKEYKRIKMSFVNSCRYKVIAPTETDLSLLPGKFNNLNIEAALKAVQFLGINKEEALKTLSSFTLPEGRLEEMKASNGVRVFIDFAHTPDSLEAALTYLKSETKGKLISVFGCAGERDHKKRSKMGRISTQIADLSIFTSEDPRTENVFDILRSIKKSAKGNFLSIPERGEAIAYALSIAKKGDVVAFFGKGHEKTMAYGKFENPWNERKVIENYLNKKDNIGAIILAAGKGTRMKSQKPKVLREICDRSILSYTLENLRKVGVSDIILVVSFRKNLIMRKYPISVKYAVQKNPKGGTGDALRAGSEEISKNAKYILALYGDDSAFFKPETTDSVILEHINKKAVVSFVSAEVKDPFGLGRVLRDKNNEVAGIIEEKEATDKEKLINEVNCGHFIFNKDWLLENIKNIRVSTTGEIYIVDLVKTAIAQNQKVNVYKLRDNNEWHGINTPEQLAEAEKKMEERLNGHKN